MISIEFNIMLRKNGIGNYGVRKPNQVKLHLSLKMSISKKIKYCFWGGNTE